MRAQQVPFQAFVDEHGSAVLAFVRGMVGLDAAEDCAQETLLAALRAYPRFDGANPRGWVLTIARRKSIDHLRATSRRPPSSDRVADGPSAVESPEHGDGEAWSALAHLSEAQRAAVVLRFALDLRYREIGAALGCSEAAARRRVADALARMRGLLEAREAA